jgi:hypothetical protein
LEQIQNLLKLGDCFSVAEFVQQEGSSLDIAIRYHSLVKDLYWKSRDLPAIIAVGRAGIYYCLGKSTAEGVPPELVDKLRSSAKAIAYDVGSFTWPGWDEPGITPGPADLAAGRDCALLNLRLAVELKKPADRVSAAHWLLGAHLLASRDFESAERHFKFAADLLVKVEFDATKQMNLGYAALAQLCREPSGVEPNARFKEVIEKLRAYEDKDAKEFAAQLKTACRVFMPT